MRRKGRREGRWCEEEGEEGGEVVWGGRGGGVRREEGGMGRR